MPYHDFAFIDGTFLHAKGDMPFSDDRFAALCRALEEVLTQCTGYLSFAKGNRLTVAQRSKLGQLLSRGGFRVAVVTEAPETRGSVTALAWQDDIEICAFPDVDAALAYLGNVSATAQGRFMKMVRAANGE